MSETFGSRLRRFALAVDIVDDDIFRQAWDLILHYMSSQLNPVYWALLVESVVNKKPGLLARESKSNIKPSFSIKTDDDRYNGLAAYSFVEEKPLWIASSGNEALSQNTPLKDYWSDAKELPHFDRSANEGIRTVILVPLQWRGRTLGLLDLQSGEKHEFTRRVTEELELLADALAVLLILADINKSRREQTLEALSMYQRALREDAQPSLLTKPQIFVACSSQADADIMTTILNVLEDSHNQIRVHYWQESSASGNINLEILKQIKESRFGLCYFSEPAADPQSPFEYQDNVNVVFEAGMFQSRTDPIEPRRSTGWIPVREQEPLSPPPPFDFAQQRMVIIERSESGQPDLEKLQSDLRAHLNFLLG